MTREQAQVEHNAAVESNRGLGVTEYKSGEKQSDKVYEVTDGLKYLPGGVALAPGMRFHPTEKQVENPRRLANKARELTRDEYAALGSGRSFAVGIDLLGKVPMAEGVRKLAVENGLATADFEGVEPGQGGQYTRRQVEAMIEAKGQGVQ